MQIGLVVLTLASLPQAKLHGYGYVYRYRKDTDTRIRQFSKKNPIRGYVYYLKNKIIIIIMQRHKVFSPPIIIMASPEWSQFMLVPRYFIRNMAPAYQLLIAGPTYHTLHFLSTQLPQPRRTPLSLSLLPSLSPGRRRRSSGLPRRHRARRRQVRRAATGSGRRRGRGGPPPSSRWIPLPPPCSLPRRPWRPRRGAEARFVV